MTEAGAVDNRSISHELGHERVLLGLLVARLIVPAVTLTPTAQQPTPPAVTQYDLPQVIALALAVAVLPAAFAVLAATRRPDPAAELRAAESA